MVMKEFTAGERLFAADLNDNFEHVEEAGNLLVPSTDDTGAPWNISYIDGGAAGTLGKLSEDVANAIAAGLSAAGGLVAVKSAIFTGTQSGSLAGGANFAVTDLTVTHEVADPANRLIISAFFGAAATSHGSGSVGIAVFDGTNLIGVGAADGIRNQVSAGGRVSGTFDTFIVTMPSIQFMHTPGAGSKTYTVRAVNARNSTFTVFINRNETDDNALNNPRAISSLIVQEVKV